MAYLNYFNDFQEREEKKNLLIGLSIAIIFHIFLLFLQIPMDKDKLPEILPKDKEYIILRIPIFKSVEKVEKEIVNRNIERIPIPDPDPNDEEILKEENEVFERIDLEISFIDSLPEIPEPPEINNEPVVVNGEIEAPVRLTELNPIYPEPARRARIEGKVILQLIIDKEGNVTQVNVLRGLPFGLTEAAVEEAKRQKFKPAYNKTTGLPVSCYWTITIGFQLK